MKKQCFIKRFAPLIITFAILFGILFWWLIYPDLKERSYYTDKDNYITGNVVIDEVVYDEYNHYILLYVTEMNTGSYEPIFIIEGENVNEVLENGILQKIKQGTEIEFMAAPGNWTDRYYMPIVELSVDGEEILSLEDGYENLLELY